MRFVAGLLSALLAVTSPAQEAEPEQDSTIPQLGSLESGWWDSFDGSRVDVEPRVNAFLEAIGSDITALSAPNQVVAEAVLEAVRDNLTAYVELLDDTELTLQELPPAAASYAIDDLLRLGTIARDAEAGALADEQEVDREQRILNGASRRRDAAFKDYVDAGAGDGVLTHAVIETVRGQSDQSQTQCR